MRGDCALKAASASLLVVATFASPAGATTEGPPSARLAAKEIRAALLELQHRVRSVYVSYRAEKPRTDLSVAPGFYLQRIVAAQAPAFFYHVSAHGHDRLDWNDDPYQQRCHVSSDHWSLEYPINRSYTEGSLRPEDPPPGSMPGEFFFLATGLWPCHHRSPPRSFGEPYMLCEVGDSALYSHVRPRQEAVDGRWCHVLERPGLDRLWVDTERGAVLLARETHSSHNGALIQRIELGGHVEAAPGLWMPTRLRNIQFDYMAEEPAARRRALKDVMMTVGALRVNHTEDALFTYRPPPGALLLPNGRPPEQVRAGGLDHLDHLVRWAQGFLPRRPSERRRTAADLAGFSVILVIPAWEVWERYRRRRVSGPRSQGRGESP